MNEFIAGFLSKFENLRILYSNELEVCVTESIV